MRLIKLAQFFAPALMLAAQAPVAFAADIVLTVDGIASNEGKVMVALFDKAAEFPNGKYKSAQMLPSAKGALKFVFKDLPAGRYAISAFHDVNNNNRLDVNQMGIPTEPLGASRDARGQMGPPKFDDAAVTVGKDALNLTIHLK
jgi:uncharacterized protein (DUF2141 family)